MPAAVESCVSGLMADWKSGKKKAPTRHKQGDKWVPIKGDKDLRAAAFAICQSSVGAEGEPSEILLSTAEVPFPNPVMVGVAATNRPHLQGLDKISFVEKEGKRLVKIPILLLGKWLHSSGILNFTQEFVDKIKDAMNSGVLGQMACWDARHKPDSGVGALGWIVDLVTEKRQDGEDQVSAIADPTPLGEKVVEDRSFLYGSIEFHPDFQNRRLPTAAMSFDAEAGEENALMRLGADTPACALITEPFYQQYMEGTMPENENGTPIQSIDLEQQMESMRLELERQKEQLALAQQQLAESRQFAAEQFVAAIISRAEAYRDQTGRAHHPVFLEWMGSVLRGKTIGEGDGVISLEESADAVDVHAYYRRAINWLAQEMPGSGPAPETPGQTEPDKQRKVALSTDKDEIDKADREWIRKEWGTVAVESTAKVGG